MKEKIKNFFGTDYFLVFRAKEFNHCWRVVTKKFLVPLPKMVNEIVDQMEKEGKTEIALIRIEKL